MQQLFPHISDTEWHHESLKNWLQSYIQYSKHSEAPDKFHFWTGVSTVAGALRRRVYIDQVYFQWTPNFYTIFVAPPGIVSKSTTLSIGMRLLKQVPGIFFGPDAVTWQALTMALAESTEEVQMSDGLYHPMSCITIASSEFGTFLNPKDREMVDVLVSLWDGQPGVWEKKTKTSGSDSIANPWINIAACTTPAWIAGNFPDYMIGGGFTSRCVFVYADYKRRYVPYPSEEVASDLAKLEQELVSDLKKIAKLSGEIKLSPEALKWGADWYKEHYDNPNKELSTDRFAGYQARKQTHMHKLAIILSVVESDSLIITKDHLETAYEIVTTLESDMPKVFSHIGLEGITKHTADLQNLIKQNSPIAKRSLVQQVIRLMGPDDFTKSVEYLINAGYIKVYNKENEIYYVYTGEK